MNRKVVTLALALLAAPAAARAQAAGPVSLDGVKAGFQEVAGWIVRAAEMVPEAQYSYKPVGTVRSFGALVGHVADGNNYYCGRAAGTNVQWAETVEQSGANKAELIRQLRASITACEAAHVAANAARGSQFHLPIPGLTQLVLPLVGRVAAGSPILAQEHVDQTYTVENSLFQHKPDYLLKVRGMSMRDVGILDGDLLAVQSSKDAKNGQIVVARLGDDVTVKRFMRRDHQIELHAENPDYKTIVVQPGEPFEIEGLAVGLIRNSFQI